MPTKLPRVMVTFPDDLFQLITRDAVRNKRSASNQVVHIVQEAYLAKAEEAEIFSSRLLGGGRSVPVYETRDPSQIASERPSKTGGIHGSEERS